MPEGNSLLNLGDISKPATVLIEKISNAVGVLYEPRKIVRKAEAEAEADKIKALASVELNALEQRAINRLVHQEARKQNNIEQITAQAATSLKEDANVEGLEEDWIAHFFKNCDTVSDKEMQSLWSNLLSGEASAPGSFSKRTIDYVASMDKKDAQLFTEFCQFVWVVGEVTPLIIDYDDDIYQKNGINFGTLKHLDNIGLVSFESVSGYRKTELEKKGQIFYFGRPLLIEFNNDEGNELHLGKVLLTKAGQELASICGSTRNEEFYDYIVEKWYKSGFILSSPLPSKTN